VFRLANGLKGKIQVRHLFELGRISLEIVRAAYDQIREVAAVPRALAHFVGEPSESLDVR
jgi:hypothetical protein